MVRAAEAALDDLAFMRTHHGEVLTVVDGSLDRFAVRLGFTQGGLFSMLSFCIAVCFLVLKPLKERYPEVVPKCIADDAHAPTVVREAADIERAAQWCTDYVKLSERELNLSANARKFKILQSRKWQDTELDVARFIKLFPSQMHEGKRKRPTVLRDALRVNGVGVGFDAAARTGIAMDKVRAHEIKLRVLEKLTPALGRQTAELLGRFTLKAATALNHVARGCEPSVTREPLEYAGETQAQLFRTLTATSPSEIRDVQHDANPAGPTERRCEEAMHLSQRNGGFGWAHPRLIAPAASTGRVLDVLYLLRRLEDVSPLVPPPNEWAASGVPMLAEAIAFIEELVSNSAGFEHGPDNDADDWRSLRNKIVADDGSVDYKGIEQVSGRHFQHVANNALQQDMFDAIVNDPKVHPATRAHFRATKQLGAGAVLGIDVVHKDVELNDKAWLHEAQGYLNHPKGAITLATRCVGVGPNSLCIYHRTRLPGCVPCDIGEARVPRTLSLFEHLSGTHWDGCNYGGWLATGHTSLNTHVTNVARAFGASAKVMEVRLGCRDPTRAHDPDTNPYQRGDGVFGNYAESARAVVYDGTCVTAVHHDRLRPLASGKRLATDYAEATKRKAKAAACDAKNCDFMTWAASTRGGIGHEAATWFNTNFDIKAAKASSDSERWRVSSERKRFLQVHSTIVARRNAAIFDYNAWPKMGGEMPRAPREQYE